VGVHHADRRERVFLKSMVVKWRRRLVSRRQVAEAQKWQIEQCSCNWKRNVKKLGIVPLNIGLICSVMMSGSLLYAVVTIGGGGVGGH